MQLLKYLWLMIVCGIALLACNSGSNTTAQSSPFQPTTITLPSGTTLTRQSQAAKTSNALQESSDLPLISISPTVISVSPHLTSTVYLNIDDSSGAIGSYLISLTVKDLSTEIIVTYPKYFHLFILEHTCSTSDLQSCSNQNRCYAYVNPAIASVNQDGHTQYSVMAMMPDSPNNCYANITQQTVWSSMDESIASVNSSGQITPINLGNTLITAGSNTYNINYLWSESSELAVVAAVPFPGGYGSLSVTDLSDITYSCSNGLNKPIYLMVNNATGILGQTVSGSVVLSGHVVYVSDNDIPIAIGNTGYGEARVFTAGHPFSLNVRECQENTHSLTLTYEGTINGYKYPYVSEYIEVID